MTTHFKMLIFNNQNEHVFAHDLEHRLKIKENFSLPKVYDANGDISKRWYLYFSFRDPKTGKLKRAKNIYGNVNLFKTKEERNALLTIYRRNLLSLLKQGYNPFEDNTELYNSLVPAQSSNAREKEITPETVENTEVDSLDVIIPRETKKSAREIKMTLKEAFSFSLKLKENVVNLRTLNDYQNRTDIFLRWLVENHPEVKTIDELTKKLVMSFLNDVLGKSSARNRNNYRTELGSLMQTLEDNEVMEDNIMKKISPLKTIPERNKTYSLKKQEEIFEYLEKKDKILLLYIKFISYNFLRPIEVCRLKIKDINLTDNTLQFKAKNSPLKTKIIPKMLLDELPDLSKMNPEFYLFTPEVIGGFWETTENNRRNYFSKRFKNVVKKHFDLNKDYGLYSFRHTYITRLYRKIRENNSPHAAKSELMLITGHSSMSALEKYLRDIDAELPKDYSHLLQ